MLGAPGGVPERSKGTSCKLVGTAFAGSNPAPAMDDGSRPASAVRLGDRLPPFLREPLGGGTGLRALRERNACDQVSHPDDDPSLALSKVTGAASRTTVLDDHGKH